LDAISSVLFGWLLWDGTGRAYGVYGDMRTEFSLENLKGRENISWFWTETYRLHKTKQENIDWERSQNVQLQYIRGVEPLYSSIRWLFVFLLSVTLNCFLEAQNFHDCWRNAASWFVFNGYHLAEWLSTCELLMFIFQIQFLSQPERWCSWFWAASCFKASS
jgi:hypothetical protein